MSLIKASCIKPFVKVASYSENFYILVLVLGTFYYVSRSFYIFTEIIASLAKNKILLSDSHHDCFH